MDESRIRRRVFGRRLGKPLSPTRQALVDQLLPELRIDIADRDTGLDPRQWFGAAVEEIWLEIGFGKGEHLAWQARHNPKVGFIGVEPFETGVASLLSEVERDGLSNIRLFTDDAALLLEALAPASLARAFLLFPDPWPKKRHHKRRFVTHDRLDLLARALQDGAEFRAATDHPDYGTWIVRHMAARQFGTGDFEWLAEGPADWRARPADWPPTRYEQKALARDARPIYLRYCRRPRG